MNIPMIDKTGRVVGWTTTAPIVSAGRMRHPGAKMHFTGDFSTRYVELVDAKDAVKAGAPAGWPEPWRCLGLCEIA